MPLNLASPGIVVREVDLTIGRVNPTSNKTGAIVAPFARGPIEQPVLVRNEQELISNFGTPYLADKHYENWLSASSFLAYGGGLMVVRSDGNLLNNACAGIGTTVKINNFEDYINLGYDENTITDVTVCAKNPGSWANGIKVALIDGQADQILSGLSTNTISTSSFSASISGRSGTIVGSANTVAISTASISVGQEIRCDQTGVLVAGTTVTSIGIGTIAISSSSLQVVDVTTTFNIGTTTTLVQSSEIKVGYGVTQSISSIVAGSGTTSVLDGYLKGVVTGVGVSLINVKVLSHVSAAGTETPVDYQPKGVYAFASGGGTIGIHTNGVASAYTSKTYAAQQDWFDQQVITLTNSTISWNTVADRPSTSNYASARGSKYDEIHVLVIDDSGTITGNSGTILEKHLNLSKASNAEFSVGSPSYWRRYLAENSNYIFGGSAPTGIVTTAYSTGFNLASNTGWDRKAEDGVYFAATGSNTLTLANGKNYDGNVDLTVTGSLKSDLSNLSDGYALFANTDEYQIDFLIMGSSGYAKETAQALASKLISVAEERKDCLAFISPYRSGLLTESNAGQYVLKDSATITDNIISFYSSIPSSSYAIFDSGYKYMYDRFSDTFRYIPLNADIAGICARNDISNFPWFSPAGTARGSILNAVKLAYNPSKTQRDRLYSNRVNPVIFSPGSGIILFGDKTGLAKASAFDRINVRRLFIYLETAISAVARDQLFEFNDETTRRNFVSTVEPFLRDIQSKRGIEDYRVICDSSNNTAAVIDSNEFIADIFVKPNRSINYIGLTFVATRSGVSFQEVVGTV